MDGATVPASFTLCMSMKRHFHKPLWAVRFMQPSMGRGDIGGDGTIHRVELSSMHVYAIAELSRLAGGAISIRHLQRFSPQRRAASDLQAPSLPLPSPHPALSQRRVMHISG